MVFDNLTNNKKSILTGLPYVVYIGFALFMYLPHFIYLEGLPLILNDSYAYLLIGKDILIGEIPLHGYHVELPLGYSGIIALLYKLGGNLQWLVGVQTLVFLLSFLLIILFFSKFSRKIGFIASFLCCLYISTSDSLLWATLVYTEAFYISSLVLFSYGILTFFDKKSFKSIFIITIAVFLVSSFRSNGIYVFGIVGVLLIILLKGAEYVKLATLSGGLLIVVLLSCTVNFLVKDKFLPFETRRAFEKVGLIEKDDLQEEVRLKKQSIKPAKVQPKRGTFSEQAFKLINNHSQSDFGDHYYYRAPKILNRLFSGLYSKEQYNNPKIFHYKNSTEDKEQLGQLIYKGFDYSQEQIEKINGLINIEKHPRNRWLYLAHTVHLSSFLFRNLFTTIVFWGLFLFSLFKAFKAKFNVGNLYVKVFIFGIIHVLSVILLILVFPRDTSLSRYSIVSEFVILLLPLYFYALFAKTNKQLNA